MVNLGTIEEIVKDMKNGVYDFTKDGKCSSCGQCCSNLLPMSTKDVKRIKRYVEKHHIPEQKHNYPMSVETFDLICPFRSEKEQKCLIYEVRPMICRDFQCNKPKDGIEASKAMYRDKYYVYDVRYTFYGK